MNERLYLKKAIFSTVVFILILTGCSGKRNDAEKPNHEGIGESGLKRNRPAVRLSGWFLMQQSVLPALPNI